MLQTEVTKFLLEAPTALLFVQFAIWLFHACNQIRIWVLQKQTNNHSRIFLALSFAALATGFGTTLITSHTTASPLNQAEQVGLGFWISGSFLFSAAFNISAHISNRKVQIKILLTSAVLLALGSYALPPIAFSSLGLTVHTLATLILFNNARSEKHAHQNAPVSTPKVALALGFWSAASLATLLGWMLLPESPLWAEKIHFSLFLLVSIVSAFPLIWMHLQPVAHAITFFGVQISPRTQRLLLFLVTFSMMISFLGATHFIRTGQTNTTQKIGQEALNTTLLSLHEKFDLLISISSLANKLNFKTCKNMHLECSFEKTAEIPKSELIQTTNKNGYVSLSRAKLPNQFFLSYYKPLKNGAKTQTELFLKVSTTVLSLPSALLPNAHWMVSSPTGNLIVRPPDVFAKHTETQRNCDSMAKKNVIVMQKSGFLLPCMPRESDKVFSADGQSMLVLNKPLSHFDGNLFLLIPTEHSSILNHLYAVGIILFLFALASLTIWNILRSLCHTARASNERKSAMVADLSHELRNPLNAILGNLEILSKGSLTFQQKRILQNTASASRSMAQIVSDVSDYSKLEAGVLELELREFELRKTIEQTAANLSYLASTKKLDFTLNIEHNVPEYLIGDPQKLGQVTSNFLSNAIKYTKQGSVELSVSCESITETHATLRFRIKDTGVGIAADAIPKLFKRFSRVGGDDSLSVEGTGLGLNIAGFLIEKFGGTVGIDSVIDRGSEFSFSIPLARQRVGVEWSQKTNNILHQKRILVATNSKQTRTSVANIFIQMGARVVESESTAHTIQILCENDAPENGFDFVCVDEDSFSSSPFSFVAQINSLALKTKPQFIQITQSLNNHDEELMARHNVFFQITKPIGPHQIHECFTNKLKHQTDAKACTRVASLNSLIHAKNCLRILVAEDNPILQEVTVAQLEELGCEATVAPDGDDAVEALKNSHFDMVFMDVRMPKMNGFHATQAIREMEKPLGHHTPIIAMTGAAMTGDKERCLAAGMDDYISKPINMCDLVRVIERQSERMKALAK